MAYEYEYFLTTFVLGGGRFYAPVGDQGGWTLHSWHIDTQSSLFRTRKLVVCVWSRPLPATQQVTPLPRRPRLATAPPAPDKKVL